MLRRAPLTCLAGLTLCAIALSATPGPAITPAADGADRRPWWRDTAGPEAAALRTGDPIPGSLLIKFRSRAGREDREGLRAAWRATRHRRFSGGAEHRRLAEKSSLTRALASLRRHPLVEYVEPDVIVGADATPLDEHYAQQWALANTGQTGGTPGADVDAEPAWDIATGSRSVRVAVIDTGVDYTHPDLAANIWVNEGEIPSNGIDDDGNGYVDDVHGYDTANDDGDPMDDNGHGTHVAGIIGAVAGNGEGIAGVCWQVSIVPVKFLTSSGSGALSDAVAAVDYATSLGVKVMNNSWGGGPASPTLRDAIARANEAGILFVAAAGNSALDVDVVPHYPASYDVPNVVSVAATDHDDRLASFSNYGAATVHLGAPGASILSSVPGAYTRLSGTSMAAPHVSGAAALIMSLAPGVEPGVLRQRLIETAEPLGPLEGTSVSGGRLNLVRLLSGFDTVPPATLRGLTVAASFSNAVRLEWIAPGDDGDQGRARAYELRLSTQPLDESNLESAPVRAGLPVPAEPGEREEFEVGGLSSLTRWYFALRARDEWGNSGPFAFATAETLAPPVLRIDPESIAAQVPSGGATSVPLIVENAGPGSLDWTIDRPAPAGADAGAGPLAPALSLAKEEPDPRGGLATDASGGPDRFGYTFKDSNEPAGPEFAWRDMKGAAVVSSLTGDDQVSEPIPIGFPFPFYGRPYQDVRISTDGWLTFEPAAAWPVNQPLPTAQGPPLFVAPFWDDLDFEGTARVRVVSKPSEMVIEYTDVPRYRDPGRLTFQVVLRSSGEMLFLYDTFEGDTTSATIGIQDVSVDGLQVAFNAPWLMEKHAVLIRAEPTWWTVIPAAGRLLSGESQVLEIRFDAAGVRPGVQESVLLLRSNDPLRPQASVPLSLAVAPHPVMSLDPESLLDFGTVTAGQAALRSLRILNSGGAALELSSIEADDPSVVASPAALTIPAGEARVVTVSWTPPQPGAMSSTIRLTGEGIAGQVALAGNAAVAAALRSEPAWLAESLAGGTVTRRVRLVNVSQADLALRMDVRAGAAPTPLPADEALGDTRSVPLFNGGFENGDLGGWSAAASGFESWFVGGAGRGFFANSSPAEGAFDVLNAFDGEAGQTFTLAREIDVPIDAARVELSWRDRIQFDSYGLPSRLPRVYEATLQDQAGGTLAEIARVSIVLDGRSYQDLGWTRRRIDLLPWAGQRVRLVIHETVPEAYRGPAQIEFDDFRLDVTALPAWLRVTPAEAMVPAGGGLDLDVTLDAAGAPPGLYEGEIRIAAGDPAAVVASLPVRMTARPVPRVVLKGGWIRVDSALSWTNDGATTRHTLVLPLPSAGGGRFILGADGDFGDVLREFADLTVEGFPLGRVGGANRDCEPVEKILPVDEGVLLAVASDGVVHATVSNSGAVGGFCPVSEHRVSLLYQPTVDRLEFGSLFLGASEQRSLEIVNEGDAPLSASVEADSPLFLAAPARLVVPPRAAAGVKVTFTPRTAHAAEATLSIVTDDPLHRELRVPLLGDVLVAPEMRVTPDTLETEVIQGETATLPVTVANDGGSPLSITGRVRVVSRPGVAGAASCAPRSLVVSDQTGGVWVLDLATLETRRAGQGLSERAGIALSRDGHTAWVVETRSSELTSLDLATGAQRVVASGLGEPLGIAVAPDEETAYVVSRDSLLRRVDLATGLTSTVAQLTSPAAIALSADGFTAWVLEDTTHALARVDLSTGSWGIALDGISGTDLVLDPEGDIIYVAGGGGVTAVVPADGSSRRFALGIQATGIALAGEHLFVTEAARGTVVRIDRFTGESASLAVALPGPVRLALDGPCESFATVEPHSAVVPPGESIDLGVRIDTLGLVAGLHQAALEISGNDPNAARRDIPIRLSLQAAPEIDLRGEPVVVSSTISYDAPGAATMHSLHLDTIPAAGAVLEAEVEGDFGDPQETASLRIAGSTLGTLGGTGRDCGVARFRRTLSAPQIASWLQDGVLGVEVRNPDEVEPFCLQNRHTVRLTLSPPPDRLDFGRLFMGTVGRRGLRVRNLGSSPLRVDASSVGGFAATIPSLAVPPHSEATLTIEFAAVAPGAWQGMLVLATNDPDEPSFTIPLVAEVVAAPSLRLEPAQLFVSLESGQRLSVPMTVANDGEGPLAFTVTAGSVTGAAPKASGEEAPAVEEVERPRFPATMEPLTPSPARLSFLVEDPASAHVYAQERETGSFYRYEAERDVWAPLSPSPLAGAGAGALLAGRIYTIARNSPVLGVYTIATDSWSTIANPLPSATGITGDGARRLYLLSSHFLRLDVVTMQNDLLAPPPFPYTGAGGMRHFDGRIYAHQGTGGRGFSSYDIRTGFWTLLPTVPDETRSGAALDPVGRAYHVLSATGDVLRFDIATAEWSAADTGLPGRESGGMAWLPWPSPGLHVAEGATERSFARVSTAGMIAFTPVSSVVPPGGSVVVDVPVDATRVPPGLQEGSIEVTSDDPVHPIRIVPTRVTVAGVPVMRLTGAMVRLSSAQSFQARGAQTAHPFPVVEPAGDGVIDLLAQGDFEETTAAVFLEGTRLGDVGASGMLCNAGNQFVVPQNVLSAAAADGTVTVTVVNAPEVSPDECSQRRHTVTLTYPMQGDRLDFGEVKMGLSAERRLEVANSGTAPLSIVVQGSSPIFQVVPASLVVPAGASSPVTVRFAPSARGLVRSTLRLVTNDPRRGEATVALAGTGFEAQRAEIHPDALTVALPPGGAVDRMVRLANRGERPLTWGVQTFLPGSPASGGYLARSDGEPGGPPFEWIDISRTGTSVLIFLDDQMSTPIPLGFEFPFYDQVFTTVRACTNGFLSFTDSDTSPGRGVSLPSREPGVPRNLLAPLWTDLDFMENRRLVYQSTPERFVLQFMNVPFKNLPESAASFQVVLRPSGSIVFQYLHISEPPPAVTVGIQNGDGTAGLTVTTSPGLLHDGLAVEISRARWIVPEVRQGVIDGDQEVEIPVRLDASRTVEPDSEARLAFHTNDPDRPDFQIPVRLHVGEVQASRASLEPSTLNPASRGRSVRLIVQLPAGLDPRRIQTDSLAINGSLPALPGTAKFTDADQDGIEELDVRIDRDALEALLSPGENRLQVTGEVRDVTWFRGVATVRAMGAR